MSCNHPSLMFEFFDKYGKKRTKFLGAYKGQDFIDEHLSFVSQCHPSDPHPVGFYGRHFLVKCGQCTACRLDRSREWADRCTMESMVYPDNFSWFCLFTYDDEHLPLSSKCSGYSTLNYPDFQKFCKNFRDNLGGFRYFVSGEYGECTLRAHYHALIFGQNFFDMFPDYEEFMKDFMGFPVYRSAILSKLWKRGFVSFAPFSWRTAAYTARYVLKKRTGPQSSYYSELGIVPEFSKQSLKPGLGYAYYKEHEDEVRKTDRLILPPIDGQPHIVTPARYFDKCYDRLGEIQSDRLYDIKEHRSELASMATHQKLALSEKTYSQMLAFDEYVLANTAKLLRRGL